jgi:hypothetical protein
MTKTTILKLIAALALTATASLASAGNQPDISWSVTLGSSHPAPAIYAPPPVVYVQPQPVYVRPAPVYVQPVTVVPYGYARETRHGKGKHRRDRDHHRHHRHHH